MSKNNRKSERKKRTLTIIFCVEGENCRGESLDLSQDGLFVKTRKPFKPGTEMTLSLKRGDETIATLTAIVARANKTGCSYLKDGMGVVLTDPPEEYRQFLANLP